ncbi:MAG: GntR family transcriptional regulator [Pseudomonadota bacterium]
MPKVVTTSPTPPRSHATTGLSDALRQAQESAPATHDDTPCVGVPVGATADGAEAAASLERTKAARPVTRRPKLSKAQQIAEHIEQQMTSGELSDGKRLPTEHDLAELYGVTRTTVRNALKQLARRGLIVSSKRIGTFVSNARIDYVISGHISFADNMHCADRTPTDLPLGHTIIEATQDIADGLSIAPRSAVIQIEEVKLASDLTFAFHTSWVPADRFRRVPRYIKAGNSVREALALHGIKKIVRREMMSSSRLPTAEERKHLEMDRHDVAVVLRSITVDGDNEPIALGNAVLCSSRVNLIFKP